MEKSESEEQLKKKQAKARKSERDKLRRQSQKNTVPLSEEQLRKKEESRARKTEQQKLRRQAQKNTEPLSEEQLQNKEEARAQKTEQQKLRRQAQKSSELLSEEQLQEKEEAKARKTEQQKQRRQAQKSSELLSEEQLQKKEEARARKTEQQKLRRQAQKSSDLLSEEQLQKKEEAKKQQVETRKLRRQSQKIGPLSVEQLQKKEQFKARQAAKQKLQRENRKTLCMSIENEHVQTITRKRKLSSIDNELPISSSKKSKLTNQDFETTDASTELFTTQQGERATLLPRPVDLETSPISTNGYVYVSTPQRDNDRQISSQELNQEEPGTSADGLSNVQTTAVPRRLDFQNVSEVNFAPKVKTPRSWTSVQKTYSNKIRRGPTWICSCCGGLFYREGVRNIDKTKLQQWELTEDMISSILYVDQNSCRTWETKPKNYSLCITCCNYAKEKRLPRLALANGLDFPVIPDELKVCICFVFTIFVNFRHVLWNKLCLISLFVLKGLTQLEERMVAPRLPFMQIKLTGFEQQWALHGNVVNVESNVNTCASCLPRPFSEMTIIQLKLMRRMSYTKPYLYEKVRPAAVVQAIKYLIDTPLYEDDNVTLAPNWDAPQQGKSNTY